MTRFNMNALNIAAATAFGLFSTVSGGAIHHFGKQCGSKKCDLLQYCNNVHNQCESCIVVCDPKSHNFDQEVCSDHCQGTYYLEIFCIIL